MSDEAELTNNEVGNAWMLHILSKLQTSWPLPINVKLSEVISETGASLGDAQRDVQAFSGLVNWLMHEKLIRYLGATLASDFAMVTLTAAGWAVLGMSAPSTPNTTIGDRVKATAADIATSAAKEGAKTLAKEAASVVTDLLGTFLAAYSRSAGGAG